LGAGLSKLVNEKPGYQTPRFLLTSTRAVAVDSLDFLHHRYDLALIEMQQKFSEHMAGIALRSVGYRFAQNGDFHLQFLPASPLELEALTKPIDTLPGIIESSVKKTTSEGSTEKKEVQALTLRLEARRLVGQSALAKAWSGLRRGFEQDEGSRLYVAMPYDISGPERSIVRTASDENDPLSV